MCMRACHISSRSILPAAAPVLALALVLCVALGATSAARATDDDRIAAAPDTQVEQFHIQVRVFETWADHERLRFDIGQRHVDHARDRGARESRDPADHRMTSEQFDAWMNCERDNSARQIVHAPSLIVESGQSASVRIGTDDASGQPIDGCAISLTTTRTDDGSIAMQFSYSEFGLAVGPPASEFADGDQVHVRAMDTVLEAGHTQFALATGYIGAPMRLIAITVDPIVAANAGVDADEGFPKIDYYAVVWEFGDTQPKLDDVLPAEHLLPIKRHGRADDQRAFHRFWLLPDGDAGRTLLRWLRDNGSGTSIGGKAGAVAGELDQWATLNGPAGWYNMIDVPPYRVRMSGAPGVPGAPGGDDSNAINAVVVFEDVVQHEAAGDQQRDVHVRGAWRHRVRFTPGSLGVAIVPGSDERPWRVMLMRARRVNSWDDFPMQTAVGAIGDGIRKQLPKPPLPTPPPVKPPPPDKGKAKKVNKNKMTDEVGRDVCGP